jgi:hypothetical protein
MPKSLPTVLQAPISAEVGLQNHEPEVCLKGTTRQAEKEES